MKTEKAILGVSFALLALPWLVGCGSGKYVSQPNEELFGTWINPGASASKVVIFSGGFESYLRPTDSEPFERGTEQITAKRTDSDGTIWYRTVGVMTDGPYDGCKFQWLRRIGDSGTTLEFVERWVADYDAKNYPTMIDKSDIYYRVYTLLTKENQIAFRMTNTVRVFSGDGGLEVVSSRGVGKEVRQWRRVRII